MFWFGDLNYRIQASRAFIDSHIKTQDWSELYKYDQLATERRNNRAFEGFSEAIINFCPTYKYDPGTQNFDTSEKCRSPAWCDRVLYRGEDILPLSYQSYPEYVDSDHKPISCWFSIPIKEPPLPSPPASNVISLILHFICQHC